MQDLDERALEEGLRVLDARLKKSKGAASFQQPVAFRGIQKQQRSVIGLQDQEDQSASGFAHHSQRQSLVCLQLPSTPERPQLLDTMELFQMLENLNEESPEEQYKLLIQIVQIVKDFEAGWSPQVINQQASQKELQQQFEAFEQLLLNGLPDCTQKHVDTSAKLLAKVETLEQILQSQKQDATTAARELKEVQDRFKVVREQNELTELEIKQRQKKLSDLQHFVQSDGELKVLLAQVKELEKAKKRLDTEIASVKAKLLEQ